MVSGEAWGARKGGWLQNVATSPPRRTRPSGLPASSQGPYGHKSPDHPSRAAYGPLRGPARFSKRSWRRGGPLARRPVCCRRTWRSGPRGAGGTAGTPGVPLLEPLPASQGCSYRTVGVTVGKRRMIGIPSPSGFVPAINHPGVCRQTSTAALCTRVGWPSGSVQGWERCRPASASSSSGRDADTRSRPSQAAQLAAPASRTVGGRPQASRRGPLVLRIVPSMAGGRPPADVALSDRNRAPIA
jgi:hypothetical protein